MGYHGENSKDAPETLKRVHPVGQLKEKVKTANPEKKFKTLKKKRILNSVGSKTRGTSMVGRERGKRKKRRVREGGSELLK